MRYNLRLLPILLCTALFCISCADRNEKTLPVSRDVLFSLPYGTFEDELYLFNLDSASVAYPARLYMRDGIFYITNGASKKVMQFTSYGDLMSVYFNPDANPVPSFITDDKRDAVIDLLKDSDGENGAPAKEPAAPVATRIAVSFPFNYPEYVTVDSRKVMYVSDRLPEDRVSLDADYRVLLQDVVHCFQSNGTYTGYLGQEGIGGAAFPGIIGLHNNIRNDVIVVSRIIGGYIVFWYTPDGVLKYRIPFIEKNLPLLEHEAGKLYPQLETIIPSVTEEKLYVKIDYFTDSIDLDTKANAGLHFLESLVYVFDINAGSYVLSVTVPEYSSSVTDGQEEVKLYEFFGVTETNDLYFFTPIETGYAVQIINESSLHIYKRSLYIDPDENEYHTFMLSEDGIISSLIASPFNAKAVWWKEGTGHERR